VQDIQEYGWFYWQTIVPEIGIVVGYLFENNGVIKFLPTKNFLLVHQDCPKTIVHLDKLQQ
jgi:hypothetical protein